MFQENAEWELYKDAACCFEQILEVAPYKTSVRQPLISMVCEIGGKMNKTC